MNRDFRSRVPTEERVSQALRSLPKLAPPSELRSQLRVLASREKFRASEKGLVFRDRFRLFSQNLMRPLALPFAGGLFSTVVFFAMWLGEGVPVHASNSFDVPTVLVTEVSVRKSPPMGACVTDDVVVDVIVDGQGRMTDYEIVSGSSKIDASLRRRVGAVLLLTEFNPATTLGTPVAGKMRLSLPAIHSYIDVKG